MKSILAAFLLLTTMPAGARADILYPAALTFEPGYASGPPQGFPWLALPENGSPFTLVGRVATVGAPFEDLLPVGSYEITYVFEGSSCTQAGLWDNIPCSGGLFATYQGGTVAFYLDATPDADFTNPATFRDGEAVLLAQSSYLYVLDDDPGACVQLPNQSDVNTFFTFTGGTWFSRVSDNGNGLEGASTGELDDNVPTPLAAQGYIFRVDGTVDVYGPVATEATTWGRVKAMYR
jgi:hypothetical protein